MVAPLLAICAAAEDLEARRQRNWRLPSVGGCAGLGGWPPIRGRPVWNAVCTRRLMLTVDANPSRDRSVGDRALITVASPLRHHYSSIAITLAGGSLRGFQLFLDVEKECVTVGVSFSPAGCARAATGNVRWRKSKTCLGHGEAGGCLLVARPGGMAASSRPDSLECGVHVTAAAVEAIESYTLRVSKASCWAVTIWKMVTLQSYFS